MIITLELRCPRCQYHYYVKLLNSYPWEYCPICGHAAKLDDFMVRFLALAVA